MRSAHIPDVVYIVLALKSTKVKLRSRTMGTLSPHTHLDKQVPAREWGLGGEWHNLGLRVYKCSLAPLGGTYT